MDAYQKKWKKQEFLDEVAKSKELGNERDVYTIGMLHALKDMARNDVWPDINFSDLDCCVWSLFRV